MELVKKDFEECANDKAGEIYADWMDGEFRCLIMRGPASLCAYIGVPEGHPFYGKDYSGLNISCHGGLTFASEPCKNWPEGFWWLGWDYAHYKDRSFYDLKHGGLSYEDTPWDTQMVYGEFAEVIEQFRNAEKVIE